MFKLRRDIAVTGGTLALVVAISALSVASAQDTPAATSESTAASAAITPAGESVVQAVWKPQEFDFHYHSFTTFYSCTSLSEKVRTILLAMGAAPQTRVRVSGCEFGAGIARTPFVRITMTAPVEATPQALAELEKTRPQRELAARVRNDRAKGIEPAGQFPAYWKRVSVSRGSLDLAPGDCELVEQIKREVLPRLAVRVLDSDVRCMPNQLSLRQPKLEVEALAELPKADAAGTSPRKKKKGST
jgi:hypothetical protein